MDLKLLDLPPRENYHSALFSVKENAGAQTIADLHISVAMMEEIVRKKIVHLVMITLATLNIQHPNHLFARMDQAQLKR
jgi:hypothetical protein